jgi:heme-degrading monooxygenase HmoA
MIARVWKGVTRKDDADEYLGYLRATGLKEYSNTKGNRGTYVLTRHVGSTTEFVLISLWGSMEDVKEFAGKDVDKAVYYPRDKEFLLNLEPTVDHFEVAVEPQG